MSSALSLTAQQLQKAANTPDFPVEIVQRWHMSLVPLFVRTLERNERKLSFLERQVRIHDDGSFYHESQALKKDIDTRRQALDAFQVQWPAPRRTVHPHPRCEPLDLVTYEVLARQATKADTVPEHAVYCPLMDSDNYPTPAYLLYQWDDVYFLVPNMPYNQPDNRVVYHWDKQYKKDENE